MQSAEDRIYLSHASLVLTGWRHLYDLLSDQERRRADAFFFERDARRFVVSHAVLRTLLSRSTGIPAHELKFRAERGRKPVLETQSGQPIHFSLSRSEELVLIGFAPRPLGVDLEWTCKTLDIPALMSDALSPREQEALIALDPAERKAAFLDCWTRKEAYLKAIGAGLSLPPASFEAFFAAATANGFRRVFAGAPWFVGSIAPRENYIGAVAIRDGLWRMEISAFATSSLALPHRKTEVELAGSSQSV